MFDIGWMEMALIAVVAIVVIGPKDLPKVMREVGIWVARARSMSRVFMQQLDEMSRQAGLDEVRKEAEALRKLNPQSMIEKTIDPDGVIASQTANIGQIGSSPVPPPPAEPVPPAVADALRVVEETRPPSIVAPEESGTTVPPPRARSESAP